VSEGLIIKSEVSVSGNTHNIRGSLKGRRAVAELTVGMYYIDTDTSD
jgi:hypothetical protein